ncbi:MAG: hypothetical protein BWY99_02168 [Synergistetes bacterium ADurb.BinA166]|nr:MAG: hypothetical protein BWY99_02168 [Synergistetes bacterium ADurb.BinA166]
MSSSFSLFLAGQTDACLRSFPSPWTIPQCLHIRKPLLAMLLPSILTCSPESSILPKLTSRSTTLEMYSKPNGVSVPSDLHALFTSDLSKFTIVWSV